MRCSNAAAKSAAKGESGDGKALQGSKKKKKKKTTTTTKKQQEEEKDEQESLSYRSGLSKPEVDDKITKLQAGLWPDHTRARGYRQKDR